MNRKLGASLICVGLLAFSTQASAWGDRERAGLLGVVGGMMLSNAWHSPPPPVYNYPVTVYSPPPRIYEYPAVTVYSPPRIYEYSAVTDYPPHRIHRHPMGYFPPPRYYRE